MMFKVTEKDDFFELNPDAKSNEIYAACSSREMKYICWVYDYDSLYRKQPIEQRKLTALIKAGFKMERDGKRPDKYAREVIAGKVTKVQAAIKEFMANQKDEDKELAISVNTQLDEIISFLRRPKETEGEWRIAVQLLEKMPKILKDRKEVMDILDLREQLNNETEAVDSDVELSELEQMDEEEDQS